LVNRNGIEVNKGTIESSPHGSSETAAALLALSDGIAFQLLNNHPDNIVPITVILVRYIISALLSGTLNDPVLNVAFLLIIPVTASYVLMIVKSRHDIVRRS
jgi:hypothetical protein